MQGRRKGENHITKKKIVPQYSKTHPECCKLSKTLLLGKLTLLKTVFCNLLEVHKQLIGKQKNIRILTWKTDPCERLLQ